MSGEFVEQRCTVPIHLHPSRLRNVREGVEEQLNGLIMTNVDDLDGVLLSYSDVELHDSIETNPFGCGFIFQERSFIHFQITMKALTWKVKVGSKYEGVVNAVATDHLALLLHGVFNVTIPLTGAQVPKHWKWEAEKDRWIDTTQFRGDVTENADGDADDDDNDAGVKSEDPAASGKKLSKKELKKLERKRLRSVMLAATGRGGAHLQAKPAAGVISRGVHVRFECSAVQHSEDYFKITGMVTERNNKHDSATALGLTGGFTPLAPVENIQAKKQDENDMDESADAAGATHGEEADFDMSALAAVTAPTSAAFATPAKSPKLAPAPVSQPKKVHTDKQQEKFLKKKAKLAERLAAKEAAASDAPATETKERKGDEDADGEAPKKKKKVKAEE